ncbi:MAG: BLUF domain-containing protein [Beijerinckiaceae bacterium]
MNNAELLRAEAEAPEPDIVFRLIYRSQSRIPAADIDAALGHILRTARTRNAAAGISGALLYYDGWFAQTLEGAEAPVRRLFDRIAADARHASVELREEGRVGVRVFPRWSMALVGEHGEPDIPLLATTEGIAPGATRRTTEEQDAVLATMRDATRGYGRGS